MQTDQPLVLVVEDDDPVRLVTSEMLKRMDCSVECVDGGRAALAALGQSRYDLVLLDVGMPIMSGAQVFTELRKILPDQPVVFMTGYTEEEIGELQDGNTRILTKPFSLQALKDVVAPFLSQT